MSEILNSSDDANVIREMIKHENQLVDQRINWMSTIQGLLFAALAFSWDKANCLIPLLCGLGGVIAVITIINLGLATAATQLLLNWYKANHPSYSGPPIIGLYIKSPVDCKYIPYITSLPIWMTFAFLIAWILVYQMAP
ncbi:hypothetical protein NP590_20020 [Methylomonas sp. SURF-2]|uniref:Transmembrane protein n=1 Tax=Methylomonas subterranea TaxID=2952225 RepID=A0ABT1TLR5_9GAMM|nr:hypothetical protein [Methylomonas sp. SURF-2]MCQ8106401.1 hypothetical protein [Methylomonas sp. SURF-2]